MLTVKDRTNVSKFMSLVLRHRPDVINAVVDDHGWMLLDDLIKGINDHGEYVVTVDDIELTVAEDEKMRYSFNPEGNKIRANQGHSITVDLGLDPIEPPDILYHGTANKSIDSIKATGLEHRSRNYVHLSNDVDTAIKVGKRHGDVVVLKIDSKQMFIDGYEFRRSVNGVWLTDNVPVKYITFE